MRMHQDFFSLPRLAMCTLSALLIMLACASLLPLHVSAAEDVPCATEYAIKNGDTTTKIARTFQIKWKKIARANDLTEPYILKERKILCIPYGAHIYHSNITNKVSSLFTAELLGNKVKIETSGFDSSINYIVKARRITDSIDNFYKLGQLRVNPDKTELFYFDLPQDLKGAEALSVCLKNYGSDEVSCNIAKR